MIELISDGTREKGGHSIFNDILLLIPNKSKWHCRYKHPMISLSGRSFLLFFTSFLHLTLKTRSFGQKLEILIQWIDHGGELTFTLSPMAISWNCCFTDQVLFPLGNIIKRLAIKLFVAVIFSEIYPEWLDGSLFIRYTSFCAVCGFYFLVWCGGGGRGY